PGLLRLFCFSRFFSLFTFCWAFSGRWGFGFLLGSFFLFGRSGRFSDDGFFLRPGFGRRYSWCGLLDHGLRWLLFCGRRFCSCLFFACSIYLGIILPLLGTSAAIPAPAIAPAAAFGLLGLSLLRLFFDLCLFSARLLLLRALLLGVALILARLLLALLAAILRGLALTATRIAVGTIAATCTTVFTATPRFGRGCFLAFTKLAEPPLDTADQWQILQRLSGHRRRRGRRNAFYRSFHACDFGFDRGSNSLFDIRSGRFDHL